MIGLPFLGEMNSFLRFEILFFFALTLLAEILGTLGGFGSSLFFVPLSQFFFDFRTVLALTGILHVFSNTAKIMLFRKTIDWKVTLWLGGSSILLAIGGAMLTDFIDFEYASLTLGIFLVCFSTFLYLKPEFVIRASTQNSVLSGSLAGFLAGFIGTGGAIRGLALASFNLEKNFFVGTSAIIDFGVDLSRTIVYMKNDYLQRSEFLYIPLLLIAAALGSYLGKLLLNKIDQEKFRRITLGLIFLTGITMIVQHWMRS
jgi:uncharacterized membrane protein YfcA